MSAKGSAIITGGTSGIGLACARLLMSHGYDVTLWARNAERGESAAAQLNSKHLAGSASFHPCDVGSPDSIQQAASAFQSAHDKLDVLINAAGILQRNSLTEFSPDVVSDQIDIVLKGTILTTSTLTQSLASSGHGVVVNIGSVAGQHSFVGLSAYGAAKAAIAHFTKTAAQELFSSGIRVVCVCPGIVKTSLMSEAEFAALQNVTPGRRLQEPEEIAQFIVELTRPSYPSLTGSVIELDDGMGLFQGNRPTAPIAKQETKAPKQQTPSVPAKQPAAVQTTEAPKTPAAPASNGKVCASSDPVLARVAKVFGETFNMDSSEVEMNTGPEDVARWDSLGNMRLIASLEKEFACSLDVNEIMEMIDVASIVEVMKSK